MADLVTTRKFAQRAALALELGGSATFTLNPTVFALYTAGPTPTPDSVADDFTPADFTGYGPQSVVPQLPSNQSDGSADILFEINFQCTSDMTPPNSIVGMLALDGSDTTKLLGAAQFDAPINITRNFDAVNADANFNIGSSNAANTVEVD